MKISNKELDNCKKESEMNLIMNVKKMKSFLFGFLLNKETVANKHISNVYKRRNFPLVAFPYNE